MLKVGDVVELKAGHSVYVELPEHFAFDNREGEFRRLASTEVTIGRPKRGMGTGWLAGRYVVTAEGMRGGGTGHGPHDAFPDGHHVECEKLQAGPYASRARVSFYESGSFTAMIEGLVPVARAVPTWNLE